jgi:hypothetical protein
MKEKDKKTKKFEQAKEIAQNFSILEKLDFVLKGEHFFFYLPSDFSLLPNKLYQDFKENDEIRDLLISIMQWHEIPLVFHAFEDVGDDLDLYLSYAIILELEVDEQQQQKIKENKIQYNCFTENSKLDLFVKILFFLSRLEEVYRALDDNGLLEEYLIV